MNTQFPNLVMMYADHVMRGLRTIESVPEMIRADVQWIIDEAAKKPVEGE